jgi:hypothetical protein
MTPHELASRTTYKWSVRRGEGASAKRWRVKAIPEVQRCP